MQTSTIFTFTSTIKDRVYNFNIPASSFADAKRILLEDLKQIAIDANMAAEPGK